MIATLADCRANLEDALAFLTARQSEAGRNGYLDEAIYGLQMTLAEWPRIEEDCQRPPCDCVGPRHDPYCLEGPQ